MSGGIRIESATIRILRTEFGRFPHILPLNPELRPGSLSLRVTLEVEWAPPDAVPLLRRYQQELTELLPELGRHRCRGPAHYHFARMDAGEDRAARANGVEPALALVHLAEHLAIDVIAYVTELDSVSGVTAALESSETRFELFVECPVGAVAPLAVYQAFSWLAILLRGEPLARSEQAILPLGRALFRHRAQPLEAARLASEAGLPEGPMAEALGRLVYLGVACRVSGDLGEGGPGVPRYRLCADRESPSRIR
jgi:hypothetical protein